MTTINKLFVFVFTLFSAYSCYSSLPEKPPCFSDGNEPFNDPENAGATIIKKCCLSEDDCIARFNEAVNDNTLNVTTRIISRFSICEPLEEQMSEFEDLSDVHGTCILNITEKNSECRTGLDCTPGRCCPAYGEKCNEKFGADINSCTICVEDDCDVL